MSELNTPDKNRRYEQFMSHVRALWSEKGAPTTENLQHWLQESNFVSAAEDMTKK